MIADYEKSHFSYRSTKRPVFSAGRGPGVIIIHEVPGITPEVIRFANRVKDCGFHVVMPSLFGNPSKNMTPAYAMNELARSCIRKEFNVLASNESSPITDWLRALARDVHKRQGGPGVGALGMCLTGNFALSMMMDSSVMAPVLCQPSLPFPVDKEKRRGLHLSDDELNVVKSRVKNENIKVLGLKFSHDISSPNARFKRLEQELGDGFEGIIIDSGKNNPHGFKRTAHSVLTTDLVDEAGNPTQQALHRVLEYFGQQLKPVGGIEQ